jgi:hypothetical protein
VDVIFVSGAFIPEQVMSVSLFGSFKRNTFLMVVAAVWPVWAHADPLDTEQAAPRCEPVFHESGIEPFGRIFSVQAGQEIRLPDFRLQAVGGANTALTLKLKREGTAEQTLVVPERRTDAEPHEFTLDGQRYVVEVGRTVLARRALAGDELVVWPRDEYQAAQTVRP